MINYILNKNQKKIPICSYNYYKNKKNSYTNISINPSKKLNFNSNESSKNIKENFLKKIISPNNSKMQVKYTKKIINELFKKRQISPEETKIKRKYNKTNTNSPTKKLIFSRYPSLKKLNQPYKDKIRLSLISSKDNNYKYNTKKNILTHNISLSNNTNITNITNNNNNITTNFTNSVNNTAGSITNNNNSYIKSYKNSIDNKNKYKQRKEIKFNIKILYKCKIYNIELNQFNNGLWLAKKINEFYKICLTEKQIDHLAKELTNHLNNIIKGIISNFKNIKNFGSIIDINKIIKENKTNNDKRYKIVVRYNHENYYFFINNNTEDINDMTNIIINNIIKKEKYDSSALREEIIKKINNSFDKKDNKNLTNSGINNN